MTMRELWDHEAVVDERYATLAWGGDGTPEQVGPTIDAIITNLNGFVTAGTMEWGCGPGRILHRLARLHPDLPFFGVDVSEAMLSLGRADRPANVQVDVLPTPLPDWPKFVYSVEVLQHLTVDEKRDALAGMFACLSPGGRCVVQYVAGEDTDLPLNHPIPEAEMKAIAKGVGFTINTKPKLHRVHDEWRWLVMTK